MKVLIVTVYNSHNSGSYLQAFALKSVLEEMGHEARFMERELRGSTHDKKVVLKQCVRSLLKCHFSQIGHYIKEWFVYEKLQKFFLIEKKGSDYYNAVDCVVIGSDTIWNFETKYMRSQAERFLGAEFEGKKIITYAASVGNTSYEVFKREVTKYGKLSNMVSILVRDSYTKQLVEKTTNNTAHLVVDPTLVVTTSVFDLLNVHLKFTRPFLLLYLFGKISEDFKKEILLYASIHKMDIISMPLNRSWCTKSIISSPQNMISYFSSAAAVVTDTFHGVAFSLIYEKPFAVKDEGKNKVSELLKLYGESERLFSENKKIPQLLSIKNGVRADGRYEFLRKESLSLLTNALNT